MAQEQKKKKSGASLIKKLSITLISLFILYVIVGFWVVAPLVKPRLEKELTNQIGRKVTIEEIKLNPLVLSATASNMTVYEIDGEPFAGFRELFVDAELSSILKWAVTFKEIRVRAPFAVLKLLPEKKLNIDDILTKFSQPKPTPDQQKELPPAIISQFKVEDGKFTVDDLTGAEAVQQVFSPLTFSLDNLSTLKEREGAFKFEGVGSMGGQYHLDGQISVNPVRLEGSYASKGTNLSKAYRHIKDQVSFQITEGKVGTSGKYILEIVDGKLSARLQNDEIDLKDFQLTEKGKDTVLISLPYLSVQGVNADLLAREVVVGRIETTDAKILTWLDSDGGFKLTDLLLKDLENFLEKQKADAPEPEPETTESQPWFATINTIEVINWNAAIEDRTLPEPVRLTFSNIKVKMDNVDNKKGSKADVDVSLQFNQAGTIKVNGSVGIDPQMADLKVFSDKITLKPFQPYVDTAVNAQIAKGTTGSKGRIVYQGKDGNPQIRYQGELSLDDLEIIDRVQTEDFIRLAHFKTSGIVLDLHPNKLMAAEVLINKPHARVTIDQNGTVNVVEAFSPKKNSDQKGKENLLQRLVNFLILQIKGPMPMTVDVVQLNDFSGDFVDGSITPPFNTRLEITKGTVKGLSSDPSAQANFQMEGLIDQSATIESTGQMNPMNALQYSKVDFALKDFDLKPVSPYAAKYVGYNITEGTLALALKYSVDNNTVNGDNIIYVDQLTLGDKVDSPDAPKLPLELGVELLKDSSGRITVQVPVGGNVKDPQFDIGHAIKSALTKTVDDAGNAPFSTIAEIDGFKGEELQFIEFEPGHSKLDERATKKLNAVAKYLNEKETLTLVVDGTANPQIDFTGIFRKQTNEGKQQKSERAEKRDEKHLKDLAKKRADEVKAYLTKKAKIPAKRVKLKPVQIIPESDVNTGRVDLSMTVK